MSLNTNLIKAVVKIKNKKYVVAQDLLEQLAEDLEWEKYEVEKTFMGRHAERIVAKHPFYDRDILVMIGTHVTTEAGTGCVHTAPGHGEDDFYVAKKYGVEAFCPVDDRGYFTDEAPGFEGMFYDDATTAATDKLDERDALLHLTFITHSYPHDWRTKQPTIFRATSQWFASIKDFRQDILEEIKEVEWHPQWGETRLYNMVRDREDWCISRQRTWGVPIPVFYGEDGTPIITDETIDHVSNLFREHGSNIWFEWEAKDLLPDGFTSEHSPNGTFTKEMDIMDVWFDSGSSHQGVLEDHPELVRPADLYLEGSDQYRGWFNSSISTAVAVTGKAPYKAVLSHGFTLDGKGRKMSKSVGNVIVPEKVMKQYGADILRLWVASVDYQSDVRVSHDIIRQTTEGYRKVRNTFRFMLGNLTDFDPKKNKVDYEELNELDRYMLVKLQQVINKVLKAYEKYDFSTVFNLVHQFSSQELSAFYLDYAKDILYIEPEDSMHRRSIQTVYYETMLALVKLITPIITHTAEEVWTHIPGQEEKYVQLTDMPKYRELSESEALLEKWDHFVDVRDDILKSLEEAREAKVIGKSLEAKIKLVAKDEQTKALLSTMDRLDQLFIVSKVDVETETNDQFKEYDHVYIQVEKYDQDRCDRCWVLSDTVGQNEKHADLCSRCADIVETYY